MPQKIKSFLLNLLLVIGSVLFVLLCAEIFLRYYLDLGGEKVDNYVERRAFHDMDPGLGWRSSPGIYRHAPFEPGKDQIVYSIAEDGTRFARENNEVRPEADTKIAVVGGSFSFGYAVSDWDTFSWQLQERMPKYNVVNYSVTAFGTYQSFLRIKEIESQLKPGDIVLYGFIDHHQGRNVASNDWLMGMIPRMRTMRGQFPHVVYDGEELVRKDFYLKKLPFTRNSALFTVANHFYVKSYLQSRDGGDTGVFQREATLDLLEEMNRYFSGKGFHFYSVYLLGTRKDRPFYLKSFSERDIPFIDCHHKLKDHLIVVGDGHPNGELHKKYAGCIQKRLRSDFH
jgi:hypothetical protein